MTARTYTLPEVEAIARRAYEAARDAAANVAYDTDARRFRQQYETAHNRKVYQAHMVDISVNRALNIQAEDAAAAIRAITPPDMGDIINGGGND